MQNLILPKSTNTRLLNWAKKESVQNIFKSWFNIYGGNMSDEKFLNLTPNQRKDFLDMVDYVKANLV